MLKQELSAVLSAIRAWWETQNEKTRKQLQQQQAMENLAALHTIVQSDYGPVSQLLMEVINNCTGSTHILPVQRIEQIQCAVPARTDRGFVGFLFHAQYHRLSKPDAADLRRILQTELDEVTGVYGMEPFLILVEIDPCNKRVLMTVALRQDVFNARGICI